MGETCRLDTGMVSETKILKLPLVAGCSTGHKSQLVHVSIWDVGQNKTSKHMYRFLSFFSLILGFCMCNVYSTTALYLDSCPLQCSAMWELKHFSFWPSALLRIQYAQGIV